MRASRSADARVNLEVLHAHDSVTHVPSGNANVDDDSVRADNTSTRDPDMLGMRVLTDQLAASGEPVPLGLGESVLGMATRGRACSPSIGRTSPSLPRNRRALTDSRRSLRSSRSPGTAGATPVSGAATR
jgi:hypothetical protein